jgi:hypothetical protein
VICNNTITGNKAERGGGLSCRAGSVAKVENTILWDNAATVTGEEIFLQYIYGVAMVNVQHSDVRGGPASVHVGKSCIFNWGTGMIDEDPRFEDPGANDFHLTPLSPCINRGTNDDAPKDDFEGDLRPIMGTVDMGADEYTGTHLLASDTFTVPESTGGQVNLSLNADAVNAGRAYMILGSLSGTAPGTPLPGGKAVLRLEWDLFTEVVLQSMNGPVFSDFLGWIDGTGAAAAQLNVPPVPGLSGQKMHYAYCLNDPYDFVSNPVSIDIVQ